MHWLRYRIVSSCVCVCVCVCLIARDTAWGIPFLLVSRETALFRQAILRVLTKKHGCILANAIDRPPNNCLSFKTINCTETYLKLYSHYPENAANSHTVFTFSSSSSLLEISLCISRDVFLVPSPVSYALKSSTLFVLTKHVNGVALNTRVVNHNFRNALTLHYNFWGYFTSSSNLFYERWLYWFSTHSHRGFKPAQFESILRAMQCVLGALCAKVEVAENNACGRTTASQLYTL